MPSTKVRRFRPRFEALEDRQLLAAGITGAITEFTVPDFGTTQAIARGPASDNELWFTDQHNNRIGRINAQGVFDTFYQVPTDSAGLTDITAGPDGNMWFLESGVNQIGRITPTGQVTEFPVGTGVGTRIVAGPDGALWFPVRVANGNVVGRITTDGQVSTFPLPGDPLVVSDITVGPDGAFWLTEPVANEIVRLTPTGQVQEFTTGISDPVAITAGPDGNLWFTEFSPNEIGRITPQGVVTTFDIGIRPFAELGAITAGPDGALWFAENAPGTRIGRITTDGTVSEYVSPDGANSITTGTDGNVWFATGGSNIDRVNLTAFESPVAFNASSYSVNEAAGTITIIVNRSGDTSGSVSVTFATSDGSAHAGLDYTAVSGTLTFGPGVTSQTFTVPILNRGLTSGSVNFNLTLSNPTGEGILGTPSTAVVTIVDTEPQPGQLEFSQPAYTVNENAGVIDIMVTRTGGSDGTVTVPYTVANGTAVNGVDYVAASGTLTFAPGQTSAVIPVTILDRGLVAGSTSLTLTLGTPAGGATLGTPAQAPLTILDNDPVRSPLGTIIVLPPVIDSLSFTVSWSGTPGSLPIASYTIYVSDNGGAYTVWQRNTTATSATFTGQDGHTYSFYCVATDTAGNVSQPPPPGPGQVTTLVDLAVSSVNPLPPVISSTTFTVSWSGGPGTRAYDVFVSVDGGPFQAWLTDTTQTSAVYTGAFGHDYAFYTLAIDDAGVRQTIPIVPQLEIMLVQPDRPLRAELVPVKVGRKQRLMVEVFYADTGALKEEFLSPFQKPAFKAIQASTAPDGLDGVPDLVVVTAKWHGRTVTDVIPG